MLPYLVYCPQNLVLSSFDPSAHNIISFQFENHFFPDSSVVLFQNPTALKTNQLQNQMNQQSNKKFKNSTLRTNRDGLKINKSHQNKKNRSHSHQNEIRNIFSNIARLVINFVALESKSKIYLLQMLKKDDLNIRQSRLCQFYREAVSQKKKIKTVYLSKSTFYKFLGLRINQTNSMLVLQQFQTKEELEVKKTFRSLAYFYLHYILPKQIIHSKKINPNLKDGHLKIGRQLLRALRLMETV